MALTLLIAPTTTLVLVQMVTQPGQERCWTDATQRADRAAVDMGGRPFSSSERVRANMA
jgi:hypothetical protein